MIGRTRAEDRDVVPIDVRIVQLPLCAAEYTEVGLGACVQRLRVGPGARLPRLPALHPSKRRWRSHEQSNSLSIIRRSTVTRKTYGRRIIESSLLLLTRCSRIRALEGRC